MKASELRIGNWVSSKCHKGLATQIFAIRSSEIIGLAANHVANYELNEIEPIPLTEEILLKAGFESPIAGRPFRLGDFAIIFWEKEIMIEYRNMDLTNVTSLHQLQNLYFALTGEELTIEL